MDRNEVPRNEMRDELDNFSESLRAECRRKTIYNYSSQYTNVTEIVIQLLYVIEYLGDEKKKTNARCRDFSLMFSNFLTYEFLLLLYFIFNCSFFYLIKNACFFLEARGNFVRLNLVFILFFSSYDC